jgi:GH25 family lysozyme M1 (1,4-beta-N-acetylmuramidase)
MTYEELGYMGRYARHYKPRVLSPHRIVNNLFGLPSRLAFPPGAVIIQQKKIPDVSFWQGEINFTKMRQMTDAAIIRAGQNLWVDSQFKRNWTQAKAYGISRGAYWFFDDRVSPGKQAELFASLLRDDYPEMEIWCDWENTYGGAYGTLPNVIAFMQRVENLLPGVKIGLYTGYFWFRDRTNAVTHASQYNYLKSRPLFLAWYTSNVANVLVPNPWSSLFLWQFGTPAVGSEYGVGSEEIDMSFINMTEADFQARYRGEALPPDEPGEIIMARYTIKTPSLGVKLRPNHDTNNAPVYTTPIPSGVTLQSDELFTATVATSYQYVGDKWAKVSYSWGGPTYVGWVAVVHLGANVCTLKDNGASEVPTEPVFPPRVGLTLDGVNIKWYVAE